VITPERFRRVERALQDAGYAEDVAWSEGLREPRDADEFAAAAVYVIVNSGMQYGVAQTIFARCWAALHRTGTVRRVFRHPGKAKAIGQIWRNREQLFAAYRAAADKLEFCQSLPWIGPTTSRHLAKDLGVDVAKPDVHLPGWRAATTRASRVCAQGSRNKPGIDWQRLIRSCGAPVRPGSSILKLMKAMDGGPPSAASQGSSTNAPA
jgi:hypothetical protein